MAEDHPTPILLPRTDGNSQGSYIISLHTLFTNQLKSNWLSCVVSRILPLAYLAPLSLKQQCTNLVVQFVAGSSHRETFWLIVES